MEQRDDIDQAIAEWRAERPELDLETLETFSRLGRLFTLTTRQIEKVFELHNLTMGEFDVLAALRRSGPPFQLTPTVLSKAVMLSPAGMTSRLDRLERAGLVARKPAPGDRRSSRVVLTAEGRRLADAAITDHIANEARLLAPLTGRERSALDQILRKLVAHVESI